MNKQIDGKDYTLHLGDCLKNIKKLDDNSVALIIGDLPYFRVKSDDWDNQWQAVDDYLKWVEALCSEWHRVLMHNGSLYVFATPHLSARVEVVMSQTFNILNHITWVKDEGWHKKAKPETLRSYFPATERIIFAEIPGTDGVTVGEMAYMREIGKERDFLFEPIRQYLSGERDRAGLTTRQIAVEYQKKTGSRTVTGMAGHWFELSQWSLPTEENYNWLRETFRALTGSGDFLKKEYEALKKEYEALRRPFNTTTDLPYTDVWTYSTVQPYNGKHPCEKPLQMMIDIITISSRPGDCVLDCVMGSGVSGEAAAMMGRSYIGMDITPMWFYAASERISSAYKKFTGTPYSQEKVIVNNTATTQLPLL